MRLKLRRQPEPLTGGAVLDHLRGRLPGPLRSARSDTQLADLSIDSLDVVEAIEDPWVQAYFNGPRGRAAKKANRQLTTETR